MTRDETMQNADYAWLRWYGSGSIFSPRVACCTLCTWVCSGAPKAVAESIRRHDRTHNDGSGARNEGPS